MQKFKVGDVVGCRCSKRCVSRGPMKIIKIAGEWYLGRNGQELPNWVELYQIDTLSERLKRL